MYRDLIQDYRTPALRMQRVIYSLMALFTGTIVNSTYARLDTLTKEGKIYLYIYIYNSHSDRDALIHIYVHNRPNVNNIKNRFALGSLTPYVLEHAFYRDITQQLCSQIAVRCRIRPTLFDRIFIENSSLQHDIKMISIRFDVEQQQSEMQSAITLVLQPHGQHHLFTIAPYIMINRKRVRDNYIAITYTIDQNLSIYCGIRIYNIWDAIPLE